ncbi:MAG: hypothetical protein P8018_03710 [Acidobacteriota bacterium]|jgi:hypothetical protein
MSSPRALACPTCGGTVSPPLGSRKTSCGFCGKKLYYSGPDFVPRFYVEPGELEETIRRNCAALFKSRMTPRDMNRRSRLVSRERLFVPFYLITGKRGGVMQTGRERVVRKPPSWDTRIDQTAFGTGMVLPSRSIRPEVTVEEDSRVTLGDFQYLYPAAVMEEWNFSDVELRSVVSKHLERVHPVRMSALIKQGELLDANLPVEQILAKGVASVASTSGEIKVLDHHVAVVYVPLVRLTFQYSEHIFHLVAEELEGNVLSGRLPFRRDWGFLLGFPLVAVLGFLVGQSLQGFHTQAVQGTFHMKEAGQVLGVIALFWAILAGLGLQAAWYFIRTPFIVRVSPGGARIEEAGASPKNPFTPVNKFIWDVLKGLFSGTRRRSF